MRNMFADYLTEIGLKTQAAEYLSYGLLILLELLICVLSQMIAKIVIVKIFRKIAQRKDGGWTDCMLSRKVYQRFSHIIPPLVIYFFAPYFKGVSAFLAKAASIYLLLVIVMIASAFLDALDDFYRTFEVSKTHPLKSVLQIIKIIFCVVMAILMISLLIGESPLVLLGSIGAMTAVLSLIFKDLIVGFVAGIRLTADDMIRIGDWIEMPKCNADGDVVEITLTTVKVMNFDKTITYIPAYTMVSDAFINWRNMTDIGGRRIKRCIYIDVNSICFCTPEMLAHFRKIALLRDYINERTQEIEAYNQANHVDTGTLVNGRHMTNIGTFRIYIEQYIKQHPKTNLNLLHLVRQLPDTGKGLPIEIYMFTNDTKWENYEAIQCDIFDHLLAVVPEFGLRVFQEPSGRDFQSMQG